MAAASFGAEDADFLLGLADKHDAFVLLELGQMRFGHVVFALMLGKGHAGDEVLLGEVFEFAQERFAHGIHEHGGSEAVAAMGAPEVGHARIGLQARHVDVEVHAVDAFDFEGDVIFEDIGDGAW